MRERKSVNRGLRCIGKMNGSEDGNYWWLVEMKGKKFVIYWRKCQVCGKRLWTDKICSLCCEDCGKMTGDIFCVDR
jgi:hypothetical protein